MARRARGRLATVVVTVLVAAAVPACASGGSGPTDAIDAYLRAWSRQDYAAMAKHLARPPAGFEDYQRALLAELRVTRAEHERTGNVEEHGARATATITNRFTSEPFGDWESKGELTAVERAGDWKVRWSRRQVHRALSETRQITMTIDWPDRAPILGAGGVPLTVLAPMVRVGIQGSRITDPGPLSSALEAAGATSAQIERALATARDHPDWFVPVIELTNVRYQQLRDVIYPVPGTVFQNFSAREALTPGLAAHVVGSTGPITAEQLGHLGSPYGPDDRVGRNGIEAAYERQLAGTPGATVHIVDETGTEIAKLAEWPATPGSAVQLTIDPAVQRAAEAALAGFEGEAALVALRASTGEVLASVSLPASREFDIALRGQYPPGSTFKIVTTADLLEHGLTPSSVLSCPATVTVAGQVFRNFEGEVVGSLTLADAVARSCNNAFINASRDLPAESFPATAARFGLGTKPEIGVAAFGGSVPRPSGPSEQAATSIGQATVTASPLAMAAVAATVAAGAWHAPRLVVGAPNDAVEPRPLDPQVAAALADMMAAVVARGTASGAGLPPGTHGKTGTAEFGPGDPPATHAWFVGYRGDVAVAVLVPGGGVGGQVAAPIAARFLRALDR